MLKFRLDVTRYSTCFSTYYYALHITLCGVLSCHTLLCEGGHVLHDVFLAERHWLSTNVMKLKQNERNGFILG